MDDQHMNDNRCETCRFSGTVPTDGGHILKCLRFPPAYTDVVVWGDGDASDNPLFWKQPIVEPSGSCGEFRHRDDSKVKPGPTEAQKRTMAIVMRTIANAGDHGVRQSKLFKSVDHALTSADLQQCLASLMASDQIRLVETPTRGRPVRTWFVASQGA